MLVVSDTSPLNYLVLTRLEFVLPALFSSVLTVPAVLAELSHPGSPDSVRTWASAPPDWLGVRSPKALDGSLGLGRGEAEAISLAAEIGADAVLIDERKGALAARRIGLFVTGTLGILELADERGLLRLHEALSALRETSFRATDELLGEMLRRADKRARERGPDV